jgi:hypothetical protein
LTVDLAEVSIVAVRVRGGGGDVVSVILGDEREVHQ